MLNLPTSSVSVEIDFFTNTVYKRARNQKVDLTCPYKNVLCNIKGDK